MALEFAHGTVSWLAADVATTTYVVSGLSFQPKALRFFWTGTQTAGNTGTTLNGRRGVGFAVGTSDRRCAGSMSVQGSAAADTDTYAANDCVVAVTDGAGAFTAKLDLSAIASDGFTLIVDDQIPANLVVRWEAWGGSDITVATVGDIAEPAATGNQNYTVTGFTADGANQCVMFAGVASTAAVGTPAVTDSCFSVGFASGTAAANQVHVTGNSDEGSATMDTDRYCQSGECLSQITTAGGNPNARASLTAWGTNLFTLNWAARGVTNRRSIFMAIKGGQWSVGELTIDGTTLNATSTVSGKTFVPLGVSMISIAAAESTAATSSTNDILLMGTASSTSSRYGLSYYDFNGSANATVYIGSRSDAVLHFYDGAGANNKSFDISAMNSDGFTVIVDDAGAAAAAEWIGYLTFGSQVVAIPNKVYRYLQAVKRAATY